MDERPSAAAIDAAAAAWVARLDRGGPDAGLDAWLAADPRHRGALIRAQALWTSLSGLPAAAAEPPAQSPAMSRRRWLAGTAGLVAAGIAGFGWWIQHDPAQAFATAIGERRPARLADGSTMLLNTDSRSRVAIAGDARRVMLDSGEAWFQVAHDTTRPFVVEAGAVRVQAVGTAFSVRRLAGRAQVVVNEGRVRVWSVDAPARFLNLTAGSRAVVRDDRGADEAQVAPARIDEALAWRRGEIVLDGMTLGDAAAEFNRYNRQQLSVEAGLADRRIVGWFRTDDVDGFARSAAAMTDARVERDGEAIRLLRGN